VICGVVLILTLAFFRNRPKIGVNYYNLSEEKIMIYSA